MSKKSARVLFAAILMALLSSACNAGDVFGGGAAGFTAAAVIVLCFIGVYAFFG